MTEPLWLQQDAENRSNLALVNTGADDESGIVFEIDIYDGISGTLVSTVADLRVGPRHWHQIDAILARHAPGTTQGCVQIRTVSGKNSFLAYAVVNDGAAPGQRRGDGAYLAAQDSPSTGHLTHLRGSTFPTGRFRMENGSSPLNQNRRPSFPSVDRPARRPGARTREKPGAQGNRRSRKHGTAGMRRSNRSGSAKIFNEPPKDLPKQNALLDGNGSPLVVRGN